MRCRCPRANAFTDGRLLHRHPTLASIPALCRLDSDYEEMHPGDVGGGGGAGASEPDTPRGSGSTRVPVIGPGERSGTVDLDKNLTARGRFIRDPETGRLVLEALVSGTVVRKVGDAAAAAGRGRGQGELTLAPHCSCAGCRCCAASPHRLNTLLPWARCDHTRRQFVGGPETTHAPEPPPPPEPEVPADAPHLRAGRLSVGADRDMVAVLGDPRVLAVLVRYESEFDALFEHYRSDEPDDARFMMRIKAAAPFCFSGRQPQPATQTMSYLDFLRSVCSCCRCCRC